MKERYKRILSGMEVIEDDAGRVRIDDLSDATGIANQDINNSLRVLVPDYIRVVGQASKSPMDGGGDPPKVLRLTPDGRDIGEEYTVDLEEDELASLWSAIDRLQERVAEVEKANARLTKKNRKLRQFILDEEL